MASTQIGSLRISLSLDSQSFLSGLVEAQRTLAAFAQTVQKQFAMIEAQIRSFGNKLTIGVTAPFAGMVAVAGKGAAGFEAAMNKVQAALQGVSPEQLKQLSEQARLLGPAVGRSAVEAAQGIETLGLAGMSTDQILRGGLNQTLLLAAANAGELEQSGAALTDLMAQFGLTVSQLPDVVNKVTGALDAGKLSFNDFRQAIAASGGVAGSAGVSFEDFNTAITGIAPVFGSGAEAGTAFKTLLTTLNPKSEDAKRVFDKLNISFYETDGRMKDLADIAGILQDRFGKLSERSRADALTRAFGVDGMQAAIGLMKLGKQGFEDLQATIAKGDAAKKLEIQLQGLEAAVNRLKASFEGLKIALGETGILSVLTSLTKGLASVTQAFADLPLVVRQVGVAVFALAAAVGPLTLAFIALAKVGLLLAFTRLGLFGQIIYTLINPIGVLITQIARLTFALTGLGASLIRVGGIIGALIVVIGLLIAISMRQVTANEASTKAAEEAAKAYAEQQDLTLQLAMATGELRKQLLEKAKADRRAAVEALKKANADMLATSAALTRAKAEATINQERMRVAAGDPRIAAGAGPQVMDEPIAQLSANLEKQKQAVIDFTKTVNGLNASINAPAGGGDLQDMKFDKPDKSGGKKGGKTAAEIAADHEAELSRLRVEELQARLDLTTDVEKRAELQREILREEYKGRIAEIQNNEDFTAAQKKAQIAALEKLYGGNQMAGDEQTITGGGLYSQGVSKELRERQQRLAEDQLAREREALEAEAELIDDRRARLEVERSILNIAEQEARSRLEAQIAAGEIADATKARADLERQLAARRTGTERQYEGPMARYLREIPKTAGEINDILEEMSVDQLKRVEDRFAGIAQKVLGIKGELGEVLSVILRIIAQQAILAATGGGGFGGFLSGVGTALGAVFGGGGGGSGAAASAGAAQTGAWLGGWAKGGMGELGGVGGIDNNILSLNGSPIRRVSRGEMLKVSPANDRGGAPVIINADFRGAEAGAVSGIKAQLDTLKQQLPGMIISTQADWRQRSHQK